MTSPEIVIAPRDGDRRRRQRGHRHPERLVLGGVGARRAGRPGCGAASAVPASGPVSATAASSPASIVEQQRGGRRTGRQRGAAHARDAIQPWVSLARRPDRPLPLDTRVVSRVRGAPADQRRPGARGRGAGPDRAGDRGARPPVQRGRRGDRAGRRPGARRDARPAAHRPRLHHLGAARGHRAAAPGLGRRDLGHRPGVRHDRLPPRRLAGRDHDVPLGGLRPREPQAGGGVRRLAGRRPRPPRLHRELDGAGRCPGRRWRTRSAASSTWPTGCCGRPDGPRTPSPTTRCG